MVWINLERHNSRLNNAVCTQCKALFVSEEFCYNPKSMHILGCYRPFGSGKEILKPQPIFILFKLRPFQEVLAVQ